MQFQIGGNSEYENRKCNAHSAAKKIAIEVFVEFPKKFYLKKHLGQKFI